MLPTHLESRATTKLAGVLYCYIGHCASNWVYHEQTTHMHLAVNSSSEDWLHNYSSSAILFSSYTWLWMFHYCYWTDCCLKSLHAGHSCLSFWHFLSSSMKINDCCAPAEKLKTDFVICTTGFSLEIYFQIVHNSIARYATPSLHTAIEMFNVGWV